MPNSMPSFVLASVKPWSILELAHQRSRCFGAWSIALTPMDLKQQTELLAPRYIFFPHWSDIVDQEILEAAECVCFHMTDVPYGRGGSPLQNLIARGHTETVISALRMVSELDAGPVYMKRPLSLDGPAHEIFARAAGIIMEMIVEIVETEPEPVPQVGDAVVFRRCTPSQSALPATSDAKELYDHIRMLDAPGYPHAFLDHGPWCMRFMDARLENGAVEAQVRFEPKGGSR